MADSIITKRAIADSLKLLTKTKTFDKISVKDISEKCGINRQTFYYHFEDKYRLLEWIYANDLMEAYLSDVSFDNWSEKLEELLTAMKQEKSFYINTINHTENYIQQFIIDSAQQIFSMAIEDLDEARHVSEPERIFISRFFAYGSCGMILEWASRGMENSPSYIASNLKNLQKVSEKAIYTRLDSIIN